MFTSASIDAPKSYPKLLHILEVLLRLVAKTLPSGFAMRLDSGLILAACAHAQLI